MRRKYTKSKPQLAYEAIAALLVIAAIIYSMIEGRGGTEYIP